MAVRGRKPKPTNMKIMEGNPGRRPLNGNEPIPTSEHIECPDWLEDYAKEEWARVEPILLGMGILTDADVSALAAYCQAYARWRKAEEFVSRYGSTFKTPSGYIQQIPEVNIATANMKIMQQFCSEFGLTPSSRSRMDVKAAQKGNANSSDGIMMKLLTGM